jgi:hypothetical protein
MDQLSLDRRDVLERAAQAAYNSEVSDDLDLSVAWAETTHAWVAVANAMANCTDTVTIVLDEIPEDEEEPAEDAEDPDILPAFLFKNTVD